jgi:uncharacterized DUF497 family protein
MVQYYFEWDTQKAKLNEKKHKVTFEEVATIFIDPRSLTIFDEDHSQEEERWITMGISVSGRLIIVCHTCSEESEDTMMIHIFSARKATSFEKKEYRGE